jgi:LPXTG-site transpeptidase (sortase) family protein
MKEFVKKKRAIILLTIGTLLIVLSLCLLLYDRIQLLKSNVFAEVEMEKYRERGEDSDVPEEEEDEEVDDSAFEEIDQDNLPKEPSSSTKAKIRKEYIGYLEIPKINLKQGMVSKNSRYNNVNYNIQLLGPSNYPDREKGNVIIAGHSGNSYLGFFKNLYKLKVGDEAKITYKGYLYTYKIVNIYNVPKTGKVKVVRDFTKSCLTLITCTHNNAKKEQTVYILERTSKVKDGDNNEV